MPEFQNIAVRASVIENSSGAVSPVDYNNKGMTPASAAAPYYLVWRYIVGTITMWNSLIVEKRNRISYNAWNFGFWNF